MKSPRQPKEAGSWTKFKLLMWKNFLQQWRHKGQTVAEVAVPVLTMCLVLVLRSQTEPSMMDTTQFPPFPASSLEYSGLVIGGMNITRMSIAYSPKNEIIEDIVTTAVLRLLAQNIPTLIEGLLPLLPDLNSTLIPPDIWNNTVVIPPELLNSTLILELAKSLINVQGYNSSTELRGIYVQEEATRRVIAAIEFPDSLIGATKLPINMSYALRFPERPRLFSLFNQGSTTWRTDHLFPVFELPGPRFPFSWTGGNDPGYVNEMFIAFQNVISREIISHITGRNLSNFHIYMQRFPHPPYVSDLGNEVIQFIFPMFILLSFCYNAVNIVRAIILEKEMQLKETMKIMGLPSWLHWTAWFCKQFIYLLLAAIFIVIILKVNWFTTADGLHDYAVFTNTPWSVLLFFLGLYFISTILLCFMLSGFFSKASTGALFTGIIWYLLYIPAFLLAMDVNLTTTGQIFTCLSINSAMSYGFQLMLARESTGGLQWGEFMLSPTTDTSRLLFGHVIIMLVVDCVIYLLMALYLEQVMPGPYGTPKPWYFFLQQDFWFPRKNIRGYVLETDDFSDSNAHVTKEDDPTGLPLGVKMKNLTKIYGANIAVNKLSLNIYDDQITVLLGHNGAGKSTTISMLTGNVEITRGSVIVAGYDMAKHTHLARSNIGLCPQHNVLFDSLTIREHLEFFSRLKGYSGKDLLRDIDAVITKLELKEKRNCQAGGLSGGQKRRLAVGIALCGGARVVLLDEPTSGMDPASRRALWDLLQKEKKGRSMILTTHFMDEADILGDRIAIMAEGRLQCVGSPFFLKRHYGVGYTLVVVKKEGFNVDLCTALINKYIPGIEVKKDRGTEVTYSLTKDYTPKFTAMLKDLEDNASSIQFRNYGLTATTLEDVFMSVGSDTIASDMSDSGTVTTTISIGDTPADYQSMEKLNISGTEEIRGIRLLWQHIVAMWLKLWLVWSRSWQILLLQILVPTLQICITLGLFEYILSLSETIRRRELTLTQGFTSTETLLSFNGTNESSVGSSAKAAYEKTFLSSGVSSMDLTIINQPVDDYYLKRINVSAIATLRNRLLIGATFDDEAATAWFSNFGYHDVANSLAAVHNAVLKGFIPEASLTVYNYPIEATYENQNNIQLLVSFLSTQLANGIGVSVGIVSAVFIMFYIKERVTRAKLLQKAAGIQPVVMWGSAAVFDWLWFCIICLTIVISCVAFKVVGMSSFGELGRLYVCIMVYGAAMLPINYVCSYFFGVPAVGFVSMFFINVLFGMMGAQIVEALMAPQIDQAYAATILDYILQFFPLYSFVTAVRKLNQIGLLEWSCLQTCDFLAAIRPNIGECTVQLMCDQLQLEHCCIPEKPWWLWDDPGVLRYVLCMLVTGLVMWVILMIAEYRLLQKVFNRTKKAPPLDESTLDGDVVDEMRYVERKAGRDQSLVARGLTKYYGKHLAVDQISFSVSDTECFGLLGVNGAGKTTTFKMLMGDETISDGDAFVAGHSVKTNITKVYENIGYCPQFDAVFGELTGRETLLLFSMLRGLRLEAAAAQCESLANALGFIKHYDKRIDHYSGGNKRKLSTAVSLLGHTRLVFVDEPTTGVDPAAKRQVWKAMQDARRSGRGVVLTSHSMEECETLCSRLTIMVNGRFQCLGTPQHLKTKFSEGFTLTIKIKVDEETKTVPAEHCDAVKLYVIENFTDPKIMEEYQGLLTYYLSDRSMAWSRMFEIMEAAKAELGVEDYSISQTSLEQIFLQFTKYQKNND